MSYLLSSKIRTLSSRFIGFFLLIIGEWFAKFGHTQRLFACVHKAPHIFQYDIQDRLYICAVRVSASASRVHKF